jgi:heterodisulfide reductase subunit A-like polyferredoxin
MKGKVGKITEENGKLIVEAEDVLSAKKIAEGFDLVVLAVGMVPENGLPFASYDDYGFSKEIDGVYPAGVAIQPMDVASAVQSAVSAAMRAIVR